MKVPQVAFATLQLSLVLNACQPEHQPDVRLPFAPQSVSVEEKNLLYYEIEVSNTLKESITVTGVEVYLDGNSVLLLSDLDQITSNTQLSPGDTSVFYMELPLSGDGRSLSHTITATRSTGKVVSFKSENVDVVLNKALVLGPPVGQGTWAAVYDPSWTRGHRRVRFDDEAKHFIPGRFAIDFIRLDSAGRYADGNEDEIRNWFGYGNDVLAVADGTIIGARLDFSESETLKDHPKYTADQATGNYIAMEIAPSVIVFYEHLKPGSIKVKKGQRMSRGEVIASVGFTGQSTGPHLHLHVANNSDPLLSEGLAFVFDDFELVGRYEDFSLFGKFRWIEAGDRRKEERPPVNSVVRFTN